MQNVLVFKSQSEIKNPNGFKVLIALSMLYMSILICNAVLTNRYIGVDSFFLLGGAFLSPFIFILDDIIAEVYGYKIARWLILIGFCSLTLFALACQVIAYAPHPSFFKEGAGYKYILGAPLLRIDLSGFIAYITANLLNSYILTRWKILLKGRKFWLRSVGSSAFSEAFYSLVTILMIEINSISLKNIFSIILVSYLIKALFSIIFAKPSELLVNYIKKCTGIDVYDFPKKFTPFEYLNSKIRGS